MENALDVTGTRVTRYGVGLATVVIRIEAMVTLAVIAVDWPFAGTVSVQLVVISVVVVVAKVK
jgi:hypothetical protein